jgi:hypothetical protein
MDAGPATDDPATALGLDNPKSPLVGDDYDHLVCELVFDKRSQPKV